MRLLGEIHIDSRPVFSAQVADFTKLSELELPFEKTVLLLIADAIDIDSQIIYLAAQRLIKRGVIYVCSWGPDCERVHDLFDEADVGDGSAPPNDFIMTTWHDKETLEESVSFFINCALPFDHPLENCSWLVATIGDIQAPEALQDNVAKAISSANSRQ